jgi:hypothetical protein
MTRRIVWVVGVVAAALGWAAATAAQTARPVPPLRPARKLTDLEARLLSASNGLTDTTNAGKVK